jgi:hypothetical protein
MARRVKPPGGLDSYLPPLTKEQQLELIEKLRRSLDPMYNTTVVNPPGANGNNNHRKKRATKKKPVPRKWYMKWRW